MKAKAARKHVRHARPAKRHARARKQVRPVPVPVKKETVEAPAPEPQMVETTVAAFEEPVEFVVTAPEPVVDVIEVYEVDVDDSEF
jgi:hypothetical protein